MTELFTDTVLNMMTTTAEPEDYTGEDGLLYCGKCRTAKEAYFPKETAAWLGHDKHPTECDCQRRSVWNVNPPRNADDTLTPLWN